MDLVGGLSVIILKPSASGPKCPAIFIKTLTSLIVLDPKENPLA